MQYEVYYSEITTWRLIVDADDRDEAERKVFCYIAGDMPEGVQETRRESEVYDIAMSLAKEESDGKGDR